MSADTLIQRLLSGKPSSIDEERRTCELLIASEAVVGGLRLVCTKAAVSHAEIVPILLMHRNDTSAMCGRIVRLRFEAGKVYGLARFTDAPAADEGWQLARAGCAVSVGAQLDEASIVDERDHATCSKWRLLEASLVPVAADPAACTRSLKTDPMTTPSNTPTVTITPDPAADVQLQTIKREADIRAIAQRAGLSFDDTEAVIAEHGHDVARAAQAMVQLQADRQPKYNTLRMDPSLGSDTLADAITRKLKGEDRAPLWRTVQDHLRIPGESAEVVLRAAWSTSDFSVALQGSGERSLMEAYQAATEGVRSMARVRQLADFREQKFLRTTQFGGVKKVGEGGEFPTNTYSEELAGSLAAKQHGAIAILTRVAMMNDDLGAFADLLAAMGAAARRAENELLAAELVGGSFDASNSLSGQNALDVESISAATLLLRRQTDANGNKVAFNPSLIVVAPEEEMYARQLLGGYNPTTAANVNPYPSLALEVDPELEGGTFYLCDANFQPLMLGTIGDPRLDEDQEFETGNYRFRCIHDFGAGFLDGRSVVRVAL